MSICEEVGDPAPERGVIALKHLEMRLEDNDEDKSRLVFYAAF